MFCLSLLAAAGIPHAPAASRNQLFLLRSTGPALTQGYKNSSREPGGIVLLCQPREDKRKTPEPFRGYERKIKRAKRLLRPAFPKPSVGPSHFLSISLSVSERVLALRWLSQSAVNEICQADHGSSRAAVNEVSGTHLHMPERPQPVHFLMPRCQLFQCSFLRGHFYTMHFL